MRKILFSAMGMKIQSLSSVKSVFSFSALVLLMMFASCSKNEEVSLAAVKKSGYTQENQLKSGGTGTSNGFYWSLYYSGGSASLTPGSKAGNFSVNFSGTSDVVAGMGWNPGASKTINYNVGSLSGGYNMVGIYGWTTSPLIEYYVCEFGSNKNGTQVNTVSSDGHTYTFYKHQQVSQPSIQGTATFWQYLDNWGGSATGSNRTVNMTNHINNWKSNGGQGFGSFNYQILAIEAWSGQTGSINATIW